MATRKQKAKVGFFLIVCLLLMIGGIFLITGFKYEPREKYWIEFDESVLGLSTGGMVEYMGVPVGNVSDIYVTVHEKGVPQAHVTIDVIKSKVTLYQGVSAQLVLYSLATGTMAVSLSGGDPKLGPLVAGSRIESTNSLVKAVSSRIEGILDDLSDISDTVKKGLAGMEEGDLSVLVGDTDALITRGNQFLDNANKVMLDIKGDAETGIDSFNKVAQDVQKLVQETTETVKTVREKVATLDVDQTGKNVNKVLENVASLSSRLEKTADSVDALSRSAQHTTSNVEYSLRETLRTLNESLNAVHDLMVYLQKDPSALVRGKGKPSGGK